MDLSRVDQELMSYLEKFPEINIWDDLPATRVLSLEIMRKRIAKLTPIHDVKSEDLVVPTKDGSTVKVRLYRPSKDFGELPALLWLHGGGYCLGGVEHDDQIVRQIVQAVGCIVLSVDYRLAPEFPFPAALNDSYAALLWLFKNASKVGVDDKRIAIGGASAGGGLAAGLALAARDRGEVNLIFQLLFCPMIDDRNVTPSSFSITDTRVWNRDCNLRGWSAYLGEKQSNKPVSPYAAAARAESLESLPATYMAVGSEDLFVDENRIYAERLKEAGVTVDFSIIQGGFHGFEFIPQAQLSKETRHGYFSALKKALFE